MFQRIDTKNRSQLAAEMLMEVITRQKFKAGDKLPPEREIAQEMEVSRNTLREAIAALQILGILEVKRSHGIFVLNADSNENIYKTISDIFKNNDDPFSVMDARIAFEPGAAIIAVQNISEDDIEKLQENFLQIKNSLLNDNVPQYSLYDRQFHLSIAQFTKNIIIISTISSIIKTMSQPLWRAMKDDLFNEEEKNVRISEHKEIFNAFQEKSTKKVYINVKNHLENSKKRFHL